MAAAIASGLIRQKRQAREQHAHRPTTHRRRKSPGKKQGLCNGNLVDIFSKVRIFGLKKRRLRRQGVHMQALLICTCARAHTHIRERTDFYAQPHSRTFSPSHSRPGAAGARMHARARTPNMYTVADSPPFLSVLTHTHTHTLSCLVVSYGSVVSRYIHY